jgi:hypothetical protein
VTELKTVSLYYRLKSALLSLFTFKLGNFIQMCVWYVKLAINFMKLNKNVTIISNYVNDYQHGYFIDFMIEMVRHSK